MYAYGKSIEGRVLPGVSVGDVFIGGMTKQELERYLDRMQQKLNDEGVKIALKLPQGRTETIRLVPPIISEEHVTDFFRIDSAKEAERLVSYRKTNAPLVDGFLAMIHRLIPSKITLKEISLEKVFFQEVGTQLAPFEKSAISPAMNITDFDPLIFKFTSSSIGVSFPTSSVPTLSLEAWSRFEKPLITLPATITEPSLRVADLEFLAPKLPLLFEKGPITLTYKDEHTKRTFDWVIDKKNIAKWIEPEKSEDGVWLAVSSTAFSSFLEQNVAPRVNVETQDARFRVGANGKVVEFQGARPGITINEEKTRSALNTIIRARAEGQLSSSALSVVIEKIEPTIKTADVNSLGITEILGVGYSNFAGSPPNRIKNIRHAAKKKLDGLLIKPGEDFSLIKALKPFTLEDGYLPELVIKGDKVIPEIGGGLCQIGSTMFRAAMNAGMPITMRQNHSLVVRYYNDSRNGLPGTDATIYEPAPDFRFLNDTGYYLLLTTEMIEETGELFFTLWGTSDGRSGFYSAPVVHTWLPVGKTKIIETTDVPLGEEKCQNAYKGAVASFTYSRILPNGEKIDRVFKSSYRSLPKICLVGVLSKEEGKDGASSEDVPIEEIQDIAPTVEN